MSLTKLPIANSAGPDIVGLLQRARPQEATAGRPIVLVRLIRRPGRIKSSQLPHQIIHGVLAHKDQLYHKRLADALANERGMDSFR